MLKLILFLLTLSLSGPLWAQPSGTFWVGESEGDDFKYTLRFEGQRAVMTRLNEEGKFGPELEMTTEQLGKDFFLLQGEEMHTYIKFRDQDEAMMWSSGDSGLYWLIKAADHNSLPLSGRWKALGGTEIMTAEIEGTTIKLTKESGEEARWDLRPLTSDRGDARVVTFFPGQDSFLMYFVMVESDLWLLRNHEEDSSLFLYRGEEMEKRMNQELQNRRESANESSSVQTSPPAETATQGTPENGFYRVLDTFPSESDMDRAIEPTERVLRYNPAFLEAEDNHEEAVVVATDRFVPMQLKEQPEKLPDATDRTMFWLGISLTPSASELLEAFTRDYLGQRVAVVAGGEVITMHTIKEVITGGKVQISRCGDRGCEILFQELEDNIE